MAGPRSYRNIKRPNLFEAVAMEKTGSSEEALDSLGRKGDSFVPSRPWRVGLADRGGRCDYVVLDRFNVVIIGSLSEDTAKFVAAAANAYKPPRTWGRKE